jgi:hypothetical protein
VGGHESLKTCADGCERCRFDLSRAVEKNAVESNNRLVSRIVDKHGRGEVSIKQATRSLITRYGVAVISVALAFALALSAKTLMDRAIWREQEKIPN